MIIYGSTSKELNTYLDGNLVGLLDKVLLVSGLVTLEALFELLDLLRHASIV